MSHNPMPTPVAASDPAKMWAFLEEGINRIMTKPQTALSFPEYTSLSTVAYNYCTWSPTGRSLPESGPHATRIEADLMCSDLYVHLVGYFATHLKSLREKAESLQDEALLEFYAAGWDRYTTGANYINRLFTYLNLHWIRREQSKGRKGLYPVYTLALIQWKNELFIPIQNKQNKLTGAILRLIESQRNGEVINQGLVKKVVDSFASLGVDETDTNKACLDVYRDHFELPFIEATERYYKHKSETYIAANAVSDYLKRAEEWLKEEEDRVDCYLNAQTRKPLVTRCEHVLIREHSHLMWEKFQSLLDNDDDEDLQRMYALLSRIPEGLEPLRKKFEDHVKKAGMGAVSRLMEEAGDSADALDPRGYVDALSEVHRKNTETVNKSFRGDTGFLSSLDKACHEFVNKNPATGTSTSRSAELLAKHTDLLLRKNSKVAEEGDLEGALNRVMILFKYIEDRDAFQSFYATFLSKRLIHGVSASDESETRMISKLKEACGLEYTNELQRMFTDMSLSKDSTDQFK